MNCDAKVTFKLTKDAEADLIRIHQWGIRTHGEIQADRYFSAFFDQFQKIVEQPLSYATVDDIRPGYRRSVCGTDSIYYKIDGQDIVIVAIIGRQDAQHYFENHLIK